MRIAHVIVDVPTTQVDRPFDYTVPDAISHVETGSCVVVEFGGRPVVGYVVGTATDSEFEGRLKPLTAVVGGPYFGEGAASLAAWIASEYACPLSEALRLFVPPGGTPKAVRSIDHDATATWVVRRAEVGPVDDRWVSLTSAAEEFSPRKGATMQRAVLDALRAGPLRAAELAADLGSVSGALKTLQGAGVVEIVHRRRFREAAGSTRAAPRPETLSEGQVRALQTIGSVGDAGGGVVVLDGVTGSGKTEIYLQAIERTLAAGSTACVLVPEISLTPQTVGRFRSRFGDDVAVLHSRLSGGERFDQWDRVLSGEARIVVGARSALFAPLPALGLIVIDEEHESSYKQGSSPRYHAREVAERLARASGAVLVLGSATPSMESRARCDSGEWTRVVLPERVGGAKLPHIQVVDMGTEFSAGHRSMFSRLLTDALVRTRDAGNKAVLFLNRRGFASFLLCRECGFVPTCDSCTTSLTYHDVGERLMCHHCGATRAVPATCPQCDSPYLRQFGAGTQRVEVELRNLVGEWPIVRMDADTTKGKGAHERLLAQFEALPSGVLLGTQMIAKGLDYPEVTLVGVVAADTTLNLPDFRAPERTYQLLSQVAGRAGRGSEPGEVVIQTYWPDHPAIVAAATNQPELFYAPEREVRAELGYPPFGRLCNVHIRGRDRDTVARCASDAADRLKSHVPEGWVVIGPSPAPLSRVKGVWRWHVLVKAPAVGQVGPVVSAALGAVKRPGEVSVTADVDAYDLL